MVSRDEQDDTSLGDREFSRTTYAAIQEGLVELLERVRKWNLIAEKEGVEPAYGDEERKLQGMIAFGEERLSDERAFVINIRGISVRSMRFLRAGLELLIMRRRKEIEERRNEGWPSGMLVSLEKKLAELEAIAAPMQIEPAEIMWEVLSRGEGEGIAQQIRAEEKGEEWDVFVSHAWEDKEEFVRPLVEALQAERLRVWYDEFTLRVGDSLRRSIDRGLSRSRYGIVVLSPAFLAKDWPQRELDGLMTRESGGEPVILPIWHQLDVVQVRKYSPMLADRVAALSKDGVSSVVAELMRRFR